MMICLAGMMPVSVVVGELEGDDNEVDVDVWLRLAVGEMMRLLLDVRMFEDAADAEGSTARPLDAAVTAAGMIVELLDVEEEDKDELLLTTKYVAAVVVDSGGGDDDSLRFLAVVMLA